MTITFLSLLRHAFIIAIIFSHPFKSSKMKDIVLRKNIFSPWMVAANQSEKLKLSITFIKKVSKQGWHHDMAWHHDMPDGHKFDFNHRKKISTSLLTLKENLGKSRWNVRIITKCISSWKSYTIKKKNTFQISDASRFWRRQAGAPAATTARTWNWILLVCHNQCRTPRPGLALGRGWCGAEWRDRPRHRCF